MLRTLLAVFALWLGLHAHAAAPSATAPVPEYALEAIAMRVHGPSWQLRIYQDGRVTYTHFGGTPTYLHMEGQLLLPKAQIDALLRSPAIAQLAPLPKADGPRSVAMHMPEFVIRLHTDQVKRQVEVYDPATLPPSPELEQFWAAWKAIWALAPQWKLAPYGPSDMFPAQPPTPATP